MQWGRGPQEDLGDVVIPAGVQTGAATFTCRQGSHAWRRVPVLAEPGVRGAAGALPRAAWTVLTPGSSRLPRAAQTRAVGTRPGKWLSGHPGGCAFPGGPRAPARSSQGRARRGAGPQGTLCSPVKRLPWLFTPGTRCNTGCKLLFNRPPDPGHQAALNSFPGRKALPPPAEVFVNQPLVVKASLGVAASCASSSPWEPCVLGAPGLPEGAADTLGSSTQQR